MSLDQLLHEATVHYRSRGFPESALVHLRQILVTNATVGKEGEEDKICIHTAYIKYSKEIKKLLNRFHPCSESPISADPSSADAVFGFAFGYQMKAWSNVYPPTDEMSVRTDRFPGRNNAVLAEHAWRLNQQYGLDLYLQFEIADVLGKDAKIVYRSTRKDQGGIAVANEFISHAKAIGKQIQTVVLVAHQHHFDRCRITLKDLNNIECILTADRYSGYDPLECQPRVMSPEEYILSDFVSMASHFTRPLAAG